MNLIYKQKKHEVVINQIKKIDNTMKELKLNYL